MNMYLLHTFHVGDICIPVHKYKSHNFIGLIYSYADSVVYLLYTTSYVTLEEVKNFKSLQIYKYFTAGWVIDHRFKLCHVIGTTKPMGHYKE